MSEDLYAVMRSHNTEQWIRDTLVPTVGRIGAVIAGVLLGYFIALI